jgi:hypothetical protein
MPHCTLVFANALYLANKRTRHAICEPQLSICSRKPRDLAHGLSGRTGQPINRLVELALERYDQALLEDKIRYPWAPFGTRPLKIGATSCPATRRRWTNSTMKTVCRPDRCRYLGYHRDRC